MTTFANTNSPTYAGTQNFQIVSTVIGYTPGPYLGEKEVFGAQQQTIVLTQVPITRHYHPRLPVLII